MGITNKETNMPETKETMPQRITLDGVKFAMSKFMIASSTVTMKTWLA